MLLEVVRVNNADLTLQYEECYLRNPEEGPENVNYCAG